MNEIEKMQRAKMLKLIFSPNKHELHLLTLK